MSEKIKGGLKLNLSAKNKRILKNTLITLCFPLAMYLVMEIIVVLYSLGGDETVHLIANYMDVKDIIRETTKSCLIAYALSFNLTCGRMDLSLGAQRLVGVIVGGNIALSLGLSGIWLVLFALVFGLIFGALTGILFVLTRVPAMVLGVGIGLVYECVAFLTTDGQGLMLYGVEGVDILINEWFSLIVVLAIGAIVMILLGYTSYGYHLRAIQGSQRIAKSSGINVYVNAILSYAFAGGATCVSGMLASSANMKVATGFTSNGPVMANMFPMFLGMYISRWSNQTIGILVASLTLRFFTLGLSKLQLNDAKQSVVTMFLFLALLIYLANENIFKVRRFEKARIAQANAKKAEMSQTATVEA
ncbi:MAG: hypothetical protein IKL61_04540 [Clostridia bacterium]|nr:hypothetical protein [Clostridia bacterium]